MTSRSICAGYTVDRRTVSAVMDHLVKEQKAQLLTVHTALNPAADPADSEDPMGSYGILWIQWMERRRRW